MNTARAQKIISWDGVYSVNDQARFLGITPKTVQRYRRELGIAKVYRPYVELTPEVRAQIEEWQADGWSREEVHRTLGIGHRRLEREFPDLKMDPKVGASLGGLIRHVNRQLNRAPRTPYATGA